MGRANTPFHDYVAVEERARGISTDVMDAMIV
jgi:hypothetical protein